MSVIKIGNFLDYNNYINTELCAVKFTAPWCGPCKKLAPFFEDLSKKYSNIKFLEVDVTNPDNEEISDMEAISKLPNLLFYNKGNKLNELNFTGSNPDLLIGNVKILSNKIEPTQQSDIMDGIIEGSGSIEIKPAVENNKKVIGELEDSWDD